MRENGLSFNGLAFLTGDRGHDTFLPPGKVSDYFGFQYMRDVDTGEMGHNTAFVTTIANNVLAVLDSSQVERLQTLAQTQESGIERFALMRLPLIKAFRSNLDGDLPEGSSGLDRAAVINYSADLYELDGALAYQRAQVPGS